MTKYNLIKVFKWKSEFSWEINKSDYLIFFFISILSCVNLYIRSTDIFNIDTIWFLTAAQRWLDGGSYLHDFYEVNPPFGILIHVPALFASKILHLSPMISMYALYSFLAAVILRKVAALSKEFNLIESTLEERMLFLALFISFVLLPGSNVIAQRDVIVVLLSLPYLLKRLYRTDIDTFYIIALLSLWIKPYYSISFLLCWIIAYFKNKIKFSRVEVLAYISAMMLYALIIQSFFKGWWHIAWIGLKTYNGFNASATELLYSAFLHLLFIIVITLLGKTYDKYPKKLNFPFITITAIFLIASLTQFKSYSYYHFGSLAIVVSIFLYNLFKMFDFSEGMKLLGVAILAGGLVIYQMRNQDIQEEGYFKENGAIEKIINQETTENDSIFVFSVSMSPLLRSRQKIASRYHHLWPLPALLKVKNAQQKAEISSEIKRNLANDIQEHKPKIIIIPTILQSTYSFSEFLKINETYCKLKNCLEIYNLIDDFRQSSNLVGFKDLYSKEYTRYGNVSWAAIFIRKDSAGR